MRCQILLSVVLVASGAVTHPLALPSPHIDCEPCLCEILYGSSEKYSPDAARTCLAANPDIKPTYWNPGAVLDAKLAEVQGLTPASSATDIVERVNRLPFLEHFLRTGEGDWTTASLKSVLQTVHLLQQAAPAALAGARVLDAGCGTGFLAAVLALAAGEVVCLEYEPWVHDLSTQIFTHKNLYSLAGRADTQESLVEKIHLVVGDATTMTDSHGSSLGQFDLVVFGMALPHAEVPAAARRSVAEGGVLLAPQCQNQEVVVRDGTRYCKAAWQLFRGPALAPMAMPYPIEGTFMLPWESEAVSWLPNTWRTWGPWACGALLLLVGAGAYLGVFQFPKRLGGARRGASRLLDE